MGHSFQDYWQWRKEHSKRTKGYPFINFFMLSLEREKQTQVSKTQIVAIKIASFSFYNPSDLRINFENQICRVSDIEKKL